MRTSRPPDTDATARPMRIALIGALLGAFASAYLLVDYAFGSGICLTGSGCDVVRASDFAYPLGVPMPLLGLGFYLAAVALLLMDPERSVAGIGVRTITLAWALLGVGVMAILTSIELVVIRALCSWCLLSTIASLVLAGGAFRARRTAVPQEATRSSRARRRQIASVDQSRGRLRRFAAISGGVLAVALVLLLAVPGLTAGTPADNADAAAPDRARLGDGPVQVAVFSDFQCPACAVAAPLLSDLGERGSITLVYRYFPLVTIHPNAAAAAEAAHAAALQGRFWEFHDTLFARQTAWANLGARDADAFFASIAAELDLDVERWRADAASSTVADVVADDMAEAERLRLSGTPTIFIDGVRYEGPLNPADLLRAVETAREG